MTSVLSLRFPTQYVPYVVAPQGRGVAVNRIGARGTTTDIAAGGAFAAGPKQRNIDCNVMRGWSNLVVLSFGLHDYLAQVPIAIYKANLQQLIDTAVAGGACVLLVSQPGAATADATMTKEAYRTALKELSDAQAHVAYRLGSDLRGAGGRGAGRILPVRRFGAAATRRTRNGGQGAVRSPAARFDLATAESRGSPSRGWWPSRPAQSYWPVRQS